MRCNVIKLRAARDSRAMTQEKLAADARVDVRTVQRAEAGDPLRHDTVADLAAALGVPLNAILEGAVVTDTEAPVEFGTGFGPRLALKRATTGRHVIELLESAHLAKLECEVDPAPENIEALRKTIKLIERLLPDPWSGHDATTSFPSLLDRMEGISEMTQALQELANCGLALFSGHSWGKAVMPRYVYELGMMGGDDDNPEMVKAVRLLVAPNEGERVSVREWTSWPVALQNLTDEDVPF